jgi:hypothetical protein
MAHYMQIYNFGKIKKAVLAPRITKVKNPRRDFKMTPQQISEIKRLADYGSEIGTVNGTFSVKDISEGILKP